MSGKRWVTSRVVVGVEPLGTTPPLPSNNCATMPGQILYDGTAHDATFDAPSAGIVRFVFSDPRASGYVYTLPIVAWRGSMERVVSEARLFLSAGQYVLTLYDPELMARVSITLDPYACAV
jgi:hypothetical protein